MTDATMTDATMTPARDAHDSQNLTQRIRSRFPTAAWTGRPGGFGGGPAPDPIPNSAVKTPSAHGTVA